MVCTDDLCANIVYGSEYKLSFSWCNVLGGLGPPSSHIVMLACVGRRRRSRVVHSTNYVLRVHVYMFIVYECIHYAMKGTYI